MQRLKSFDQAQDFLSAHAIIHGHFRPRQHRSVLVAIGAHARKRFRSGDRNRASSRWIDWHMDLASANSFCHPLT